MKKKTSPVVLLLVILSMLLGAGVTTPPVASPQGMKGGGSGQNGVCNADWALGHVAGVGPTDYRGNPAKCQC